MCDEPVVKSEGNVFRNNVVFQRTPDIADQIVNYVGGSDNDFRVNIQNYFLVPLERVKGIKTPSKQYLGFWERVLNRLGYCLVDIRY